MTLLSPVFWLDFLGFDVFLSVFESTELFLVGWDFFREDSVLVLDDVDTFLTEDNFLVDMKICSLDFSVSSALPADT